MVVETIGVSYCTMSELVAQWPWHPWEAESADLLEKTLRMNDTSQSISHWIVSLKSGESAGAQRLYRAVYERLLRLAKRKLDGRKPRWADEEDVALSAFHSFCNGVEQQRFPQLDHRDDLWKILTKITCRKAKDYIRWSNRQKRGGGLIRGESIFESPGGVSGGFGLADAAESPESPDVIVAVAEECERLLNLLEDDTLRQIAIWKLEGYTDSQIADRLGCVVRTVERKSERIRQKWGKEIKRS